MRRLGLALLVAAAARAWPGRLSRSRCPARARTLRSRGWRGRRQSTSRQEIAEPELGELVNLRVVAARRAAPSSARQRRHEPAVSFSYGPRRGRGPASIGPVSVATATPGWWLGQDAVVAPGSLAPPRRGSRRRRSRSTRSGIVMAAASRAGGASLQIVTPLSAVVGQPVTATVVLDTTAAVDEFGCHRLTYPGWWTQRRPPEQVTPSGEIDGGQPLHRQPARLIPCAQGAQISGRETARGALRSGRLAERHAEIRVSNERLPCPRASAARWASLIHRRRRRRRLPR
jgi:hypothetical protein